MKDQYYLQDSRNYVGNDILWWGKDRKGYVCDIFKAHVFTKEEAIKQNAERYTDIPWPKEYIDARLKHVVDMQCVTRMEALKGTGIKLYKPKPPKKERFRCVCGKYITESKYYSTIYHGDNCCHI